MKVIKKTKDVIKALNLSCSAEELENTKIPEGFGNFISNMNRCKKCGFKLEYNNNKWYCTNCNHEE